MHTEAKLTRITLPSLHSCARCALRPLNVCAAIKTAELWELERLAQSQTWQPKAKLFSQDDVANFVYNITAGVVRLSILLPDGRRQIIGFALPGDFLGLALSDHHGFCADVVETVTACRYARRAFSDFLDEKPRLLRRLHEFATHELSLAHEQMIILGRRNARERLASFLIGLRDRRARILGRTSAHIAIPMSRQDIADFLGLTIETVSRMMNRLARERLIVIVPDGVRLLNVTHLEALTSAGASASAEWHVSERALSVIHH
jgi:CRP/FNR family transcriptional regulator